MASVALATLEPPRQAEGDKSYALWFVLAIAVLLLILARQVVVAVKRDRSRPRTAVHQVRTATEAEERSGYAVDELGDVDDLEVDERVRVVTQRDEPEPEPDPEEEPHQADEPHSVHPPVKRNRNRRR
jgi:flagellar biosynthesis/type III secretory pathway M-ring protein FliF/YscJ